jgi:hypothetical protein
MIETPVQCKSVKPETTFTPGKNKSSICQAILGNYKEKPASFKTPVFTGPGSTLTRASRNVLQFE